MRAETILNRAGTPMTLETESVLDRRNLRRRIGLWRGLAIGAGVLAVGAMATHLRSSGLGDTKHIARISIDGMITEDRDMLRLMKRVGENKNVQGVVLFINSPGGTTTGGEALFEAVRDMAKTKPVVAQFGTVAASAAYITGLATDHIVARGNSITGSVGVIFQWPEVSGLLDKVGVKMNEIKSGPLKAVPSMFEPVRLDARCLRKWWLSRRSGFWGWSPAVAASSPLTFRALSRAAFILGARLCSTNWLIASAARLR
jgi:protease IV